MTEMKLSEINKLLPLIDDKQKTCECAKPLSMWDKKEKSLICVHCNYPYNEAVRWIKYIGTKNLLDYVEAVVCPTCQGNGERSYESRPGEYHIDKCPDCENGLVIRVKEGK